MNQRPPATQRILLLLLTALIMANVVYLFVVGWPTLRAEGPKPEAQAATGQAPTASPSPTVQSTLEAASAGTPAASAVVSASSDVFLISLGDGASAHFFIFHPLTQSLKRLTNQAGEDCNPALSPDGRQVAFSSRRNGYWDLYILTLDGGQVQRVTDSPE